MDGRCFGNGQHSGLVACVHFESDRLWNSLLYVHGVLPFAFCVLTLCTAHTRTCSCSKVASDCGRGACNWGLCCKDNSSCREHGVPYPWFSLPLGWKSTSLTPFVSYDAFDRVGTAIPGYSLERCIEEVNFKGRQNHRGL